MQWYYSQGFTSCVGRGSTSSIWYTGCIIQHLLGGVRPYKAPCFSCTIGLKKHCWQCETCHLLSPPVSCVLILVLIFCWNNKYVGSFGGVQPFSSFLYDYWQWAVACNEHIRIIIAHLERWSLPRNFWRFIALFPIWKILLIRIFIKTLPPKVLLLHLIWSYHVACLIRADDLSSP